MIREPRFWRERSAKARMLALSLAPAAGLYDAFQRWAQTGARAYTARSPVFCAGAATVGGVGKTPFALLIAARLKALGQAPWFLTRGYGGLERGPKLVNSSVHGAAEIGDEAVLLAAAAPTIVARDRPSGAKFAAGADAIILDDGYQNARLRKDCSFLLIGNADPCGNGHVFPAGPLREPMQRALARADAVVLVGDRDLSARLDLARFNGLVFRARLELDNAPQQARVTAFAGIGSPARFFDLLQRSGFDVVSRHAFPDHHPYTADELSRLRSIAQRDSGLLITTSKDFARLPIGDRTGVLQLPVVMRVDDQHRLDILLAQTLDAFDARESAEK